MSNSIDYESILYKYKQFVQDINKLNMDFGKYLLEICQDPEGKKAVDKLFDNKGYIFNVIGDTEGNNITSVFGDARIIANTFMDIASIQNHKASKVFKIYDNLKDSVISEN